MTHLVGSKAESFEEVINIYGKHTISYDEDSGSKRIRKDKIELNDQTIVVDNMLRQLPILEVCECLPQVIQDKIRFEYFRNRYNTQLETLKESGILNVSPDIISRPVLYRQACIVACLVNGENIDLVPHAIIDEYVLLASVYKKSRSAINFIPRKFRPLSERVTIEAILSDYRCIRKLTSAEITENVICKVLETNGSLLKCFGSRLTSKHYHIAFKQDKLTIRLIPDEFKSRDMCFEACIENAYLVNYIPEIYERDPTFYTEVVRANGSVIAYMPAHLITEELSKDVFIFTKQK